MRGLSSLCRSSWLSRTRREAPHSILFSNTLCTDNSDGVQSSRIKIFDRHFRRKQATPKVHPNLWKPRSGLELMNNDLPSTNPEDSMSCFDLSKNDSYLMSATGGMISIFDTTTFKTMKKVMPLPPAATCLTFHPRDGNIVAIGMDNSTIVIYNLHSDEVTRKLEGHAKRVPCLLEHSEYFCVGCCWVRKTEKQIVADSRWEGVEIILSDAYIQIHQNELHLLAINKTHLAVYEVKELACV